jgi:hypothetical protein
VFGLLAVAFPLTARAQVFGTSGGPPLPGAGFMCAQTARVHFTTAADTVLVNLAAGKNIYFCDYAISVAGATNVYLESSAANACTSPTQITQIWYSIAGGTSKQAENDFYRGLNTGVGLALCVNSSGASVAGDVTVYYTIQ